MVIETAVRLAFRPDGYEILVDSAAPYLTKSPGAISNERSEPGNHRDVVNSIALLDVQLDVPLTRSGPQTDRCPAAMLRSSNLSWMVGFVESGQSNKPACGGARPSGKRPLVAEAAFSVRWASIFSMTTGSSMQAITLMAPPHSTRFDVDIE